MSRARKFVALLGLALVIGVPSGLAVLSYMGPKPDKFARAAPSSAVPPWPLESPVSPLPLYQSMPAEAPRRTASTIIEAGRLLCQSILPEGADTLPCVLGYMGGRVEGALP